ncbi:hypothetical protein CVT91_06870 [Candidatus Atribacteria bacterium HGW-Atribacteria-1]|nr:MAG: hypothetical protein CVT91_06870 [Candidatus Atribacteria bacterium HGW-Atribacteria-1]
MKGKRKSDIERSELPIIYNSDIRGDKIMDFKFDESGLIKKIKKEIEQTVPIEKLLNPTFMKKFAKSSSLEELILKSGLVNSDKEITDEIFKAIPKKDLDKYIRKNTKFSSWQDMLNKAATEYLEKK